MEDPRIIAERVITNVEKVSKLLRALSKEERKLYQRLREIGGVPDQQDDGGTVFDRIKEAFAND